jgi:carboxypeptidase Taq
MSMNHYESLARAVADANALSSLRWLLFWDTQTMLRPSGRPTRGRQMAVLEKLRREKLRDPRLRDLLGAARQDASSLGPWERRNVELIAHEVALAEAVEDTLGEELSRVTTDANAAWASAKATGDFATFAGPLQKMLGLQREVGRAVGGKLGCGTFEGLMRVFDHDATSAEVDTVLGTLKAELPPLIDEIRATRSAEPVALPSVPVETQHAFVVRQLHSMGYTDDIGRIDFTVHPFCTPEQFGEGRIALAYREDDPRSGLMAALHEVGHAFYELGLPGKFAFQPVGMASGFSTHESQSTIVEMQAGRTREFIRYLSRALPEAYKAPAAPFAEDNLHRWYRRVQPGPIRIEADEVTYALHIVIRHELENRMLDGTLAVSDLPSAWNELYRDLLGVNPRSDSEGCLQDVHWSVGFWGYFPSYALGVIKASQFFAAATAANRDILPALGRNDWQPLLSWLRQHVHGAASLYDGETLMRRVTGQGLSAQFFLQHLRRRYLERD